MEYPSDFEVLAIRQGCQYDLFVDEPSEGVWWAVKAAPVTFPGPHTPFTPDGAPVEQYAIVAAGRNKEGLWQWCNLSPIAKRLFGDLLFQLPDLESVRWHYVVETQIGGKP